MLDNLFFTIKENVRLLIGAIVVIFVLLLLLAFFLSTRTTKVIVNNQTFKVMVAKSDKDKQVGLSKKNKIADDQGMLFVFKDPDYYSF